MPENRNNLIDFEDFRIVLKFISKNWYLLIAFPLVSLGLALIYTHRMPDIFAAKSEILLKNEKSYDYQSQIYASIGSGSMFSDVTNQKRIISSYDIISETLSKVDFSVSYFIVGRVKTQKVESIDVLDVSDNEIFNSNLYELPFEIKVISKDTFQMTYEYNDQNKVKNYPLNEMIVENGEFKFKMNLHPIIRESSIKELVKRNFKIVFHSKTTLVDKYKSALKVENLYQTSILNLYIEDQLKGRGKTFLDSLAAVYIDYSLQSEMKINLNTQTYIQKQLNEITLILDSIETDLETYKDKKAILDLSREQTEYFNSLVSYEAEKRKLSLSMKSLGALQNYVLTNNDSKLLPPAAYVLQDDEILAQHINAMFKHQMERNELLTKVTPNNPEVIRLDSNIISSKQDLLMYIDNTLRALGEQINEVNAHVKAYKSKIKNIPKSQRDIINIERKLQVNEELYLFLLEKRASTVIAAAGIVPQTSVIEKARVLGVVGPNKSRFMYSFVGVGFVFALLIGFIRMMFYERIENIHELKQLSKIPVIGGVPNYIKADHVRFVIDESPRSVVTEAFRSIRTNLQYLLKDGNASKTILVSSLHPGEGKTFISRNVAGILAKANKKVLLLDFDLHKPKVHKSLDLDNKLGISSYLIGKNSSIEDLKKNVDENLDVITAGPVPPNASELILSERVGELIEKVKAQYDYLIIDTPPIMLISDSLLLLKHVDAGLFVLNTTRATKMGVSHLEEIFEQNNIDCSTSLILNNIKQSKWKYYYSKYGYMYGYNYNYNYGYGYGYTSNKKEEED